MLLQGLTLAPLLKLLHLPEDGSLRSELTLAHRHLAAKAEAWLERLAAEGRRDAKLIERVRRVFVRRTELELDLAAEGEDRAAAEAYRSLERELLAQRRRAAVGLRDEQVIDDEALRVIERELDLEEMRIAREEEGEG
jgi:CPA1 family monovalent cation:H+ antiporter